MVERTDADILADLDLSPIGKTKTANTPREARIIAGFEDIQRFFAEHGRAPQHGTDCDIFERLYAARLDRLRDQPDCVQLLRDLDPAGLLASRAPADVSKPGALDDNALLAALGVDAEADAGLTELKHVRSASERRAAEDVAVRQPCADFRDFEPIFQALKADLADGIRQTRRFERKSEIEAGRFFIVDGLTAYVAEAHEVFLNESGNRDRRLRVIYDNGTESNLLARSLQKALTQDPSGRRITEPGAGPLFDLEIDGAGNETGTVYVLRSRSDHPEIAQNRDLIHKIGVTGGEVERRLAGAEKDPTFLMAPVEIVATFRLFDINRAAIENLLHRVFARGRLEIMIPDRLGVSIRPREWFLVPLPAIRDAVEKLQDRSLHMYEYRPESAQLIPRSLSDG